RGAGPLGPDPRAARLWRPRLDGRPGPGPLPRSAASRAERGRAAVADLLSAAVGAAGAADGLLGPGYRPAHLHHRRGGDRLRGLAAVPADRVGDGRAGDAGSGREAAAGDDVREA